MTVDVEHPGQPLALFVRAYDRAVVREPFEANAMNLATVDAAGRPRSRVVLLKGVDETGLCFFTNYDSDKGRELLQNPSAALCFHWPKGAEQVRLEGEVTRLSEGDSDAYFATRDRASQLGAWASIQSQELDSPATFERRVAEMTERFASGDVPRPGHWGGYRLAPRRVEFWYGRPSRLHDRHLYERSSGEWSYRRLYP